MVARADGSPFDRIIVPIDPEQGPNPSVEYASILATRFGCQLTLLSAVDDSGPQQAAVDSLGRLATSNDVETLVSAGEPVEVITTEVSHHDRPLIAMATRNPGPLREALFGSVTSRVMREVSAPMLLTGPACQPVNTTWGDDGPRTILICLDRSRVADRMLPVARRVAEALDLSVLLLYVVYPTTEPAGRTASLAAEDREMYDVLASTAAAWRHEGVDVTWEVAEGTWAPDTIVGMSVRREFDLIAMASHGHSALKRMLTGSTTVGVLEQALVPILTMRPTELLH